MQSYETHQGVSYGSYSPILFYIFKGGAESGVAEQRRRRDEERAQRENGMARGKLKQNIYICKLVLTRCN